MATAKGDLLVNGYIRMIKKHLSNHTVIPIEIISLCLSFWIKALKYIMISKDRKKFKIYHTDNKHEASITPSHAIKGNSIRYIENISQQVKVSHMDKIKQYDGILYFSQTGMFHVMCCLFEADTANDCNDTEIPCHTIKMGQSAFNDLLYCGYKYGVIEQRLGDLYQMNLQKCNKNIDYQFKKIEMGKDQQIWDFHYTWGLRKFLSIEYLPKSERIFAVYNSYFHYNSRRKRKKQDSEFIEQSNECGIFDFQTKTWIKVASIKTRRRFEECHMRYYYELCADEYGDNVLYAVSNTGNTQRYDIAKDEWREIVKDGNLELHQHRVWKNNMNIIGCGDGAYFGLLDVTENTPKWDEIADIPKTNVSGIAVV